MKFELRANEKLRMKSGIMCWACGEVCTVGE